MTGVQYHFVTNKLILPNITAKEIENNPFLMIAISPDLDLIDASGKFYPNQDGVNDSYSVGLAFTCVAANFNAPGDVLVP